MPGKVKDLTDAEILRFLRFSVVESAAATFTEQEYDTQLSIDRAYIWLIWAVEIEITPAMIDDPAQNATESMSVQITRESKSAILNFNDSDCLIRHCAQKDRFATIGTEAGPAVTYDVYPKIVHFPVPIPYAGQNIYVAVESTSSSARTAKGRIHYTLRKVSEKFFLRVAHALI